MPGYQGWFYFQWQTEVCRGWGKRKKERKGKKRERRKESHHERLKKKELVTDILSEQT